NFNPGNNPSAADAYRGLQDQLKQVDAELKTLAPIGEANGAAARVAQHQAYVGQLTAGFPTSASGKIDKAAFAEQVKDVAQAQVALVEGQAELSVARKAVAAAQAKGDKAAAAEGESRVRAATAKVTDAVSDLDAAGINVTSGRGG